jgi:hypothetical protein
MNYEEMKQEEFKQLQNYDLSIYLKQGESLYDISKIIRKDYPNILRYIEVSDFKEYLQKYYNKEFITVEDYILDN